MNERRFQIIQSLTNNNGKYSIKSIAEKFKVTERTIRYDLEEINLFFTNKEFPIFFGLKNGIITILSKIYNKSETINLIKGINLDSCEYTLSPKERKYLILIELFFAENFITINYLANIINVCRNTITNDLDKVKNWLIESDINPTFIPSKGLNIEGKEESIRKAVLKAFREALPLEQYLGLIQNNLYNHTNTNSYSSILFNYLFNNITIKEIQNYIDILQKKLNITFSDLVYIELILCLAISIQRIKLGKSIYIQKEEKLEMSNTNVYREVNLISNTISENFDIDFTIDEITYFSQLILSSNTNTTPVIEDYPNPSERQAFTTNLIAEVGERLNNDLTKDSQLYDGLSAFVLPFNYRQKYHIQIYNPYLKEIKANYPKTFDAVKSSVSFLELNIENPISDDEIGYITLYFAAALESQNEFNVLIICGTGFSIANLLSTKLRTMFNINVVGMAPINEASKMLEKYKVDLIVSTSTFINTNIPCVVVNPFLLTQEDILLLRKHIKECRINKIISID